MKKTLLFITALALVAVPLFASASVAPEFPHTQIWNPGILKGPLVVCYGGPTMLDANGNQADNPHACTSLCDLVTQFLNIIYYVIAFVIWIIIPIDVAIGGIMYMLAGPNPGMVTKAKTILIGAVWAIAITLCSFVIVATFVKVMNIAGVGGFNQSVCNIAGGSNSDQLYNQYYDSTGKYIGP